VWVPAENLAIGWGSADAQYVFRRYWRDPDRKAG
jgi:hypothetical protein